MKPLFTIHAGEYLTGEYIEKALRDPDGNKVNLWIPSKDTGVDFLVTDQSNKKSTALQVKFSKDFLLEFPKEHQDVLVSSGWWNLNREKIKDSKAEYWVFVLHGFTDKKMNFIIISPSELIKKMDGVGQQGKEVRIYLTITKSGQCFQTRGLSKSDRNDVYLNGATPGEGRDFTAYLNNWSRLFASW